MVEDKFFQELKSRWEEVMMVPSQRVGVFTPLYKNTVPYFKVAPWRVIGIAAVCISALLYLQVGPSLVAIVSILQKGF